MATEDRLVVWGGELEAFNSGLPGADAAYTDGAAFDLAAGEWEPMAGAPLPDTPGETTGVNTSAGVLVARGVAGAVWDPMADSWRRMADAPSHLFDLTSTGTEVLSISANAVLDVESGTWRSLPVPPVRLERPTAAWTGDELIVIGGPDTPFTSAAAIAYDPHSDAWRALAAPPSDLHAEALAADWDGRRVVVVNYDMTAVTYRPDRDEWQRLPRVPARFFEWYPSLRSVDGYSVAFMGRSLVVLRGSRWVPLPYAGIPTSNFATVRAGYDAEANDGALYVLGIEDSENMLVGLDIAEMVERPRALQVGVGTVTVPPRYTLAATDQDLPGFYEATSIILRRPNGKTCEVVSGGTGLTLDTYTTASTGTGEDAVVWERNDAGTAWRTEATSTDLFTIECDSPDVAEQLARSTRFALPGP